MIRIFVDADACPVKKEIERINSAIYSDYFLVDNTPYDKFGPGLYDMVIALGKKEVLKRLAKITS